MTTSPPRRGCARIGESRRSASCRHGNLFALSFSVFAVCGSPVFAAPNVFVSRPGEVVRLSDLNGDGDYLDSGERLSYCAGLPAASGAIATTPSALFVARTDQPIVLRAADLNGDGDALDANEVTLYAEWAGGSPAPTFSAVAGAADGVLYVADSANGRLLRLEDTNGDGDALDFGELLVVGDGLTSPVSLAVRPDGCVLVAQNLSAAPVRILRDRNGDGDFFDFAENLGYAESMSPGSGLAATGPWSSFLARPATGDVMKLHDLTRDDDALDAGEVVLHAANMASATHLAADGATALYVAATDAPGTVYRVEDSNADGDALDIGEVIPVAEGITMPAGIAVAIAPTVPSCVGGDLNADGSVTPMDAPLLANTLIDPTGAEMCRADANDDGLLDGRDVAAFVAILLP